ncbi:gamma-glutamyltransferase family protein [Piscinibacter gummiphilus]|uniref:Gamma-glutamyltransferase n=1 Tax=Piscinibacter gummiphilus TaxID=946333 RepID=A0A1W6LCC7_9BURK|nr:gamma-glutamyltransferase family protein [Piscinibacter gummiphilus]ARN21883.1 gamma-glutamyltransferase [Piscinibacter gummiphilus]ATU66569.1 gamma-glutamyltransferase family protein [Piscinibacter gummiphilus]GLS93939.1 gamma-glutamyltranspeptidase [Piscinibacter gummiphilus]
MTASATPFDWRAGYPSRRLPVFGRNVVSTSHPLGAQAGLRVLMQGGNAVDAAIASAAVMTVVEPVSNGLGSDAFCIVWDGQRLHGLNASGRAPAAWSPDYFRRKYGDAATPPQRGWDSVTVPGAVAGWVALSERFGKLPFADLMAPAIEIAERGYAVPVVVQQKWAAAEPLLKGQPGFAGAFLPKGRAPGIGERFRFPDAARTLDLIARTKGQALYGGEVAEAAERHAREHGAVITAADFAGFRPEWVDPVGLDYAGHTLHEIPPNGQGIAAQIALGILAHFDLGSLPVDGVESQHLQIEAMKLAFADVYRFVSEPASMTVTVEQLLDPAYLADRATLIDRQKAQDFGAGNPVKGGTIYLTAADEQGMMVSFIQSNFMGFGSGVVVPGYGLSMQNRGHAFSLDAASPNVVAPGKRPFHTIIPGFLSRDGAPVMSFGVMGASLQPQGHVQTLVRLLNHRQNPQAACDAPRWRYNHGLELNVEATMRPDTVAGLSALGHRLAVINDSYQDFGAGQFIWRLGDPAAEGYLAASDSRRDGLAAAY